ncbi:MAG: hypothetical protein QOJ13_3160 [Gaiellales bacterium]|jgi:hypothetical protein|nr:hypothetical protein [Gaiellales bacterium]
MPNRPKAAEPTGDGAVLRAVVAHALGAPGSSGEIAIDARGGRAVLASAASGSLVIGDVELAGTAQGVFPAERLKPLLRSSGEVEVAVSRRALRVKAGRTTVEVPVTPGPSDYSWMWPTDQPQLTAFFVRGELERALDAVSDWDDVEFAYGGRVEGFELRSGSRSQRIEPVRRPRRRKPLALPVHLPTLRLLLAGHSDQVAIDVWELRGMAVTSDVRLRGLLLAGHPQPQRRPAVDLGARESQSQPRHEPESQPEPVRAAPKAAPRQPAGDARVAAARQSAARYLERAASQLRGAQERLQEVDETTGARPIAAALKSVEQALKDLGAR